MRFLLRFLYAIAAALAVGALCLGLATLGAWFYVQPGLPGVSSLRDVRLQVPMHVYTRDGRLMAEFGEQRRIPLAAEHVPPRVRDAFLAAEDDRFFEHPGVDWQGLTRAAISLALTGEPSQGGGTITMQVARNFFLSREKTISRKVREIFLALKIERLLSKQEILTLYLNKIFLGQRAYGVGAAAEVYFGKAVGELELAEIATVAGLPRAPSSDNPVTSPQRALARRDYVLRRMLETGAIDSAAYEEARQAPMTSRLHGPTVAVYAPWLAEMARQALLDQVGPEAYTEGYQVVTTLDSRLQPLAQAAIRQGLALYDRRHGYRGPIARLDTLPTDPSETRALLESYPEPPGLRVALVRSVDENGAAVQLRGLGEAQLPFTGMAWARPFVDDDTRGDAPKSAAEVLRPGDVILLTRAGEDWELAQAPDIQGALVALDPRDGAIVALGGGFDFESSKFNRAVQAIRQPGSAFKPFIYSAALERGFTPATVVNDAPVVFEDAKLEDTWRPKNYTGRFYGPIRFREALVHSRNLVSIRVLDRIGVPYTVEYLERFGFGPRARPRNLTLALGSGGLTPLELATGYAVFANGGYRIQPYFIDRIYGPTGEIVLAADPAWACADCAHQEMLRDAARGESFPEEQAEAGLADEALVVAAQPPRVVDPQNAWLIGDMLHDVVQRGTGAKARELGRRDLAGKTGTTNDGRDTWFAGFNADLVATAWVGFDQERSLGRGEAGAATALPMWMAFMGPALEGAPERRPPEPPGLVTVRISPDSGLLARAGDPAAIFETFRVGQVPESSRGGDVAFPDDEERPEEDPLF